MGEHVRRSVRERYLDLVDWVDIRPDPHYGWCIWLIGLVGLMAYFLPSGTIVACLVFGALLAPLLLLLGVVIALAWVAAKGLSDVVRMWRAGGIRQHSKPVRWVLKAQPHAK